MRVLLVGPIDLLGISLVEKLCKENHNVSWLVDGDDEYEFSKNFHAKIYRAAIENSSCRDIFRANSIDTVIFMETQRRENYLESGDTKCFLIPKLQSVLRISKEININQFVFLSSSILYKNTSSVIDIELRAAEELVQLHEENFIVNIVRLSNVFGKSDAFCNNFINEVIFKMINNEAIICDYSLESQFDFVSASDASDALYRILLQQKSMVVGVVGNELVYLRDIFKMVQKNCNYKKDIDYGNLYAERINVEYNFNDVARNDLGWFTMYPFKDNAASWIDENCETLKSKNVISKNIETKKKLNPVVKALIENFLLFGIVILLIRNTEQYTDFRFIDLRLVYVVLMSTIYGGIQSIIAIILACLSYLYANMNSGIDITYILYSIESWTPLIMYIITGSTVSYMFDKKSDDISNTKAERDVLARKYEFLKSVYKDVCDVKNHLQKQITVSKDSFGKIYDITRQLDTFEPQLIFFKTISIIEKLLECDSVGIYVLNRKKSHFARLIAYSLDFNNRDGVIASLDLEKFSVLSECINNRQLFVNRDFLPEYPDYAMPVIYEDEVVALITIANLSYDKFALHYQNKFQILCGLVQSNLVKAYKYAQDRYENSYYENSEVLKTKEFEEQLVLLNEEKSEINVNYIVTRVKNLTINDMSPSELSYKFKSIVRDIDILGCKDGVYYIILMQTKLECLGIIKDRFSKKGIQLEEVNVC